MTSCPAGPARHAVEIGLDPAARASLRAGDRSVAPEPGMRRAFVGQDCRAAFVAVEDA